MTSGKQRRAAIKAARLRREFRQQAALRETTMPSLLPLHTAAVNPACLAPYNSYGEPDFVNRGYYQDQPFVCVDCGAPGVWSAQRQKWWYEIAKGNVWSCAIRCPTCRARRRAISAEGRRTWMEGMKHKQAASQPAK
ncbi:MAG TPA: zinc-ribbon domain containing protein [Gallionellaceae bacterium]